MTSQTRSAQQTINCTLLGCTTVLLFISGILLANTRVTMSHPMRHETESPPGHRRHSPHRDDMTSRPSKWINPCRIPTSLPTMSRETEIQPQSDAEILQNIITQVRKAENQARDFLGDFFEDAFGSKFLHDNWKDLHYDWLASVSERVGKYLGEEVPQEKLAELDFAETLRSMYEGLQRYAVGLEQIVLDQAVYGGQFHQHFQEAEFQLKYVLCELQIAMLEKNVKHTDITREIMAESYRDLDEKTTRNLRDWVIFRDYVNTLEYVRQSFTHFLKMTEQGASGASS